jgi:hypothetical protein
MHMLQDSHTWASCAMRWWPTTEQEGKLYTLPLAASCLTSRSLNIYCPLIYFLLKNNKYFETDRIYYTIVNL